MADRLIRIFISSPADVRPERLKAEQIVARLDREFAYHFHVEAVLWEREPLVATHPTIRVGSVLDACCSTFAFLSKSSCLTPHVEDSEANRQRLCVACCRFVICC